MPSGLARCCSIPPSPPVNAGHYVGCGLLKLFNVADITNSQAESHFKATRQVLGELLKVNTANWSAFPLKYKVIDKHNSSTRK